MGSILDPFIPIRLLPLIFSLHRSMEKRWFVFYTKSRQEKKIRDLLQKSGYEVFLPLQKVMRQWSDRKKKVEVPLFNSYIFVHEQEHRIPDILKIPGIAWTITFNGKPAVLRNEELELIERFISSGLLIETSDMDARALAPGETAQVVGGPLAGITGVLTGNANHEQLNVFLEGIHQVIRVRVPVALLRKPAG